MILKKEEFLRKYKENSLKIALIGMSNTGKSFRSISFSKEFSFDCLAVDKEIAASLDLMDEPALASWMGQPYEEKYEEHQKIYLDLEDKITRSAISKKGNVILDTTGSFPYLLPETHQLIKNNFLIIHFLVKEDMLEEMKKFFFDLPKSIVWGNLFEKKEAEDNIEALKRLYPKLLAYRLEKYKKLADITLSACDSRSHNIDAEEFFLSIQNQLI